MKQKKSELTPEEEAQNTIKRIILKYNFVKGTNLDWNDFWLTIDSKDVKRCAKLYPDRFIKISGIVYYCPDLIKDIPFYILCPPNGYAYPITKEYYKSLKAQFERHQLPFLSDRKS